MPNKNRKKPAKAAARAWLKAHKHQDKGDRSGDFLDLIAAWCNLDPAALRALII